MSIQEFIIELKILGYNAEVLNENRIVFDYSITEGKFAGQTVKLGLEIPPDWSLNPPGGLHVLPKILPINPNATGHPERVVESPNFGPEWEYWSRPYPPGEWPKSKRTVKDYLRHIRHLFFTQ
jgi:hypothetical protein